MNPLSLVAYFGIQPRLGNKQREVLESLMELNVATDREICNHLKWEINRITNRRGELLKKNLIVSAGLKRNEYGNLVEMWKINPNYKLQAQGRTINRMGLGPAQEKLPIKKVRYCVIREGKRVEVN